MKMFKNGFKLIVIRDGQFGLKQFSISPTHIVILLLVIILGVTGSLFLFSDSFAEWAYTRKLDRIKEDNSNLVDKIKENEKRVELLIEQLEVIKEQDRTLRDLVKLPQIHDDIREVGIGGNTPKDESGILEYLLPVDNVNLLEIDKRIDFLSRLFNLESLSYTEILDQAKSDVERYRSYPAIYPVELYDCKFTSNYGYRRDPFTRRYKFHDGHDFSARTGTPVHVTADGVVKLSKYYGTYGNYIEIDHGYGYSTVYAHLAMRKVKVGEKVIRGQNIGTIGNTRRSTAPHLHYEIKYKKKNVDPGHFYFEPEKVN